MNYLTNGAIAYLEKPFVNFDQLRDKLDALYPQMTSRRGSRTPSLSSLSR
jgi:hypothetical protein